MLTLGIYPAMRGRIGTSGWQYKHWKGNFYPDRLPTTKWLAHYGEQFDTVELNSTFYRLPKSETFARWADEVPAGFLFSVKASRYLTHVRRLREPQDPVRRLLDSTESLGKKLGPVLLQLPPNMKADAEALSAVLAAFPASVRVAVEFRHESWYSTEVRRVLEKQGSACVLSDTEGRKSPLWRTADWTYARFHAGRAQPPTNYGRQALKTWASDLAAHWSGADEVFAYFNNDGHGCAPRNALTFAEAI